MRKNNSQLTVHSLHKKAAFTLAEMMVVMLILTICLAAFAPLMTKKKTVDQSVIWQYSAKGSDIYYGLGARNSVMIGQKEKADKDLDSRLILSNNSLAKSQPYLTFKNDTTSIANLILDGYNYIFSGPYNNDDTKYQMKTNVALDQGLGNTAFGPFVLGKNTTGAHNTAFGENSLYLNTTGSNNTAYGHKALYSNIVGLYNTAIGAGALEYSNASDNTAVGLCALQKNTNGTFNTAMGIHALSHHNANNNTAVGYSALRGSEYADDAPDKVYGSDNTAVGFKALYSNVTGQNDVANGSYALYSNTTGQFNTADGSFALYSNTTGRNNTANGFAALYANTYGGENVAIGYKALYSSAYGSNNVAIGYKALYDNVQGHGNTAIGGRACTGVTTSYNTCIGADSGPGVSSATANTVYLGNINSTIQTSGKTSTYSDRRLKDIHSEYKSGLEALRGLTAYNYTFKSNSKDKPKRVGIMAQDLQKVIPEAVSKDEKGYLSVSSEYITYAMFNAIKQLDKLVSALIGEVRVIGFKLNTLIEQENAKDLKIKELEQRIEKLEKALQ